MGKLGANSVIGPLWPYAQETLRVDQRMVVWDGEIRSAKTITSLVAFVAQLMDHPGPAAMLGHSEESLRRNIEPILRQMLGGRLDWKKSEAHIAGHPVWILGAATEGAAARLAGMTLRTLYVDEITGASDSPGIPESAWNMGTSRLSLPDARIFGTCMPASPNHWLWKKWLKDAAVTLTVDGRGGSGTGDVARCRMRMADNPYLPPEYRRFMRSQYSGVWAKRYLDGEWVAGSGRIFDMFTPERHVCSDPEWAKLADQSLGIDYGTTHPFAAMHGLVLPSWEDARGRGRVHIADEWVYDSGVTGTSLTDGQYSVELRKWQVRTGLRPAHVYVPPEAASMYAQLRLDGWDGVRDADNGVLDGLRVVANLFGTDRLTISPRCVKLIEGLGRYSWDEKAEKEQPLKEADDEVDALRYTVKSTEGQHRQTYREEAA